MTDNHALSGGSESRRLDAAQADLDQFPTQNIYDGGCATCGCEIPIVLEYENGDPVPDAEFVVKWGELRDGPEGETIVESASGGPADINGVVDANGLAHIKNVPCSSFIVLFGEGSDALEPAGLSEHSELYRAIEAASETAGVGSLSDRGRGQLLWWLSAWLKEKHAEHLIYRARNNEMTSRTEMIGAITEYGAPLWTSSRGEVNESRRSEILDQIANAPLEDLAHDAWDWWGSDGALVDLEEELQSRSSELWREIDDRPARQVARSLIELLQDGNERPNARFYQVLGNVQDAQRVAAQLFNPDEPGAFDVFLLVAEAVLGFVPIVGDIIDVVDIVKWLYKFSDENETANTWDYVELGALSLGFIPAVGFFLKKTFAPIARFFAGLRGAQRVTDGAHEFLQMTIRVLRNIGEGNIIKWLRRQASEVARYAQEAKNTIMGICNTVVAALEKYISRLWFRSPGYYIAQRLKAMFDRVRNSINDFLDPFFDRVDSLVDEFIQKMANRFTATASSNSNPHVFKLGRQRADGSGGLGKRGEGERPPEGTCPVGMRRAMGSNPINMILGQPFQHHTDFSIGLFKIERTWTPGQGGGLLGPSWSTALSSYVKVSPGGAKFQTSMGRKIPFDLPFNGAVCANIHAPDYELIGRANGYAVRDADNLLWIYEQHDGTVYRLSSLRDENGNGFDLKYAVDQDAPLGMQPCQFTLTNGDIYDLHVKKGRLEHVLHNATGVIEAQFEYCQRGLLIGVTNAAGYRLGYGYDKQRRLIEIDYNNEHKTRYLYDECDRVIEVKTDTQYYHDRFEYGEPNDKGIRRVRYIDTLGYEKTVAIDREDNVVAITEADGATTAFTYNDNGDIASEQDPVGVVIESEWDRFSNLVKKTYPDGTSEIFERDERGRLLAYTNPGGAQWHYERDERGNVVAEKLPDGRVWRYALNERGQATAIHAPDGALTKLSYNEQQRLCRWRNPRGGETNLDYDARGRVIRRTEASGASTQFEYDTGGRMIAATLADGSVQRWRWSARGELLFSSDGEGKITQREYGPFGLLEAVTDPMGGNVRFERDRLMRLVGVINENGERYRYEYDGRGRVVNEVDFTGRSLAYRYDAGGRLVEKVAADGVKTRYTYNGMRRLSRMDVFEQGELKPPAITRFLYDDAGHIVRAQNRDATVEFKRDLMGRVLRETLNGRVIESEFDQTGRLCAQRFDGRLAAYQYTSDGELCSLQIGEHTPLEFHHDVMGREQRRSSGAGFVEHRRWNQLGQLHAHMAGCDSSLPDPTRSGFSAWDIPTTASEGVAAARTYEYDKAFNPTAIRDARWGLTRYHYNANDQITQVDHEFPGAGIVNEQFDYDPARNIADAAELERGSSLSLVKAPPTTQHKEHYRRTPGGRIERRGDTTYAYDAQGRLISKRIDRNGFRPQKWHYQWDGQDQLRRVTTPDKGIWEYYYDPFGRRIKKTCVQHGAKPGRATQKVDYLWSGNQLSEERRLYADGTEQTVAYHYERNSFRPLAQEVDGELHYIVTDQIGTPRELLSEQGELVWSAKQKLWGKIADTWKVANDDEHECLLRFQGQIEDRESGLYYNRFRYYEPDSGEYISSDPIKLAGGLNTYSYGRSPVRWVDPLGLSCHERGEENERIPENYDPLTDTYRGEHGFRVPDGDPDEMVTVYRGVHPDHPDYQNAVEGNSVPWGGHSDPVRHNAGENQSEFTSWTTDRNVAQDFSEDTSGSVILEQQVRRNELVWSPDTFGESEVLRYGPTTGATVTVK